ncbi:MAG: spore gernimation protein [Clostridium sp.]|nr:spore gernimation protein [Clostridium sp.]
MNKMSTKHFMFFIIATCTIALRSYSSIFISYGGRDSWIISILASIFMFLYFLILMNICEKTNTYNFIYIVKNSTSNMLGKFLLFIFSIGLFISSIEAASVECSSIHSNFFLSTPTWYCLIFFLFASGYVLNRRFNSIIILVVITVFFVLIGDIILFALVAKYLDFRNLLPLLKDGFNKNIWMCLLEIIGSFSAIAISLPYLKNIEFKKYLVRYSSFAVLISGILITSSFLSIITFFGPERGANIFYPEYVQSQRVQIALFLEFGELFYIFRSTCMWFIKYILASYGILFLYKDNINNKKLFIILYNTIIFIASYLLTQNQFLLFYILKILQIFNGCIYIFIPIICFSLYYFKNKKAIKITK